MLYLELNSFKIFCKTVVKAHQQQSFELKEAKEKLKNSIFLLTQVEYLKKKCAELSVECKKVKQSHSKLLEAVNEDVTQAIYKDEEDLELIENLYAENSTLRQMLGINCEVQDIKSIQEQLIHEETLISEGKAPKPEDDDPEAIDARITELIRQAKEGLKIKKDPTSKAKESLEQVLDYEKSSF